MRTAIMKRSELATKFRVEPTDFDRKVFKKQRKFCNSLLKKRKKKPYENLDLNKVTNNREFLKMIKSFLSDKFKCMQKNLPLRGK